METADVYFTWEFVENGAHHYTNSLVVQKTFEYPGNYSVKLKVVKPGK